MNILDLQILQEVIREGGITKAAKKLAMTQPGVSQHIKALENEIGHPLFDRRKNRLYLNDLGRTFLSRTTTILKDFEQLKNISGLMIEPEGTLKLGLTDSSTQTIIPPNLKIFRDRFPKVHLELIVSESDEIEDGVIRGRYDLGVISGSDIPHPLLEEHVLDSDRIDCLVSKHDPLAKRREITLEQLVQLPLIMYPRQSRTRQIIDKALRDKGLVPTEIMDVCYNSAAVRLAEAGLGVAMLSRYFIQKELARRKCHHLRIEGDPFKRNICVVRKKNERLSEPAYQFFKLLVNHIAPSHT